MDAVKKLAGQSAIYGLSSIIGRFLNYLLVPLHTNFFTQPGEYGIVTEIYAYISFLLIIFTYGMETSFFNFTRKEGGRERAVYSTAMSSLLATTVLLTGAMIMFAGPIAGVIRHAAHPEYVSILAMIVGLDALSALPFAKLRQQSRAKKFALIKIMNIMINILGNVFFFIVVPWMRKSGIEPLERIGELIYLPSNMVVYVFVSNLMASAITLLLLLPELRFSIRLFNTGILREMIIYALPLLVAGFAGMINETLDRVLIKYLVVNPEEAMVQLGIYGACYKLSILMTLFIQAFRYAAEPFFFSQYEKADARKSYAVVMKYFVLTCAFIFLFVMMYMDIFQFFIGEPYRIGLHIVPILLIANMFLGIFFNLSMWYKLTGKTMYGAYFAIIGAGITVGFNFLLIPAIGYEGAAWTTLICYFTLTVISYLTGSKVYPIDYKPLKLLTVIIFSVVMYLLSEFLSEYLMYGIWVRIIVNTLILFIFTGVVYKFDHLKEIRRGAI